MGPNCSLICDCEFGECNTNATSDADKCSCAPGYTGTKCDQFIDYCDPGILLSLMFLIHQRFLTFCTLVFLVNDTCNENATNRICQLTPTNRDTFEQLSGYNCLCKNGYEKVSDSDFCQGIS